MSQHPSSNLYGSAPDSCETALLLIDVINDLDFEGHEQIMPFIKPMARQLKKLRERCRDIGIPIIYTNDNFGRWRENFEQVLDHCLHDDVPGQELSAMLKPHEDDYFVLKPKHSAFYCTSLEVLLEHLGARRLILTGVAGNICVLFTASDAFLRDYEIVVPSDCTASEDKHLNDAALKQMEDFMKATVMPSEDLDLQSYR